MVHRSKTGADSCAKVAQLLPVASAGVVVAGSFWVGLFSSSSGSISGNDGSCGRSACALDSSSSSEDCGLSASS